NAVYFTGSLCAHPERDAIIRAVESAGKEAVELSERPAQDFGSILFI
ncbi:MAG: DUF6873 family GME fold protein, partial [Spirochaetota bacterium]